MVIVILLFKINSLNNIFINFKIFTVLKLKTGLTMVLCTLTGMGGIAKNTPPPISRRSAKIPRGIFLRKLLYFGKPVIVDFYPFAITCLILLLIGLLSKFVSEGIFLSFLIYQMAGLPKYI